MGEDAIERWHQIRMRHYARIKGLRSIARQKNSQAKYECTTTHVEINKTLDKVIAETNRKWKHGHVFKKTTHEERLKIARYDVRNRIKSEIENEGLKIMHALREIKMKEYIESHSL